MSTSIPYDPSLTLGNIVPAKKMKNLEGISELQTPIDASLNELNSALLLRRKLGMVKGDLANLGIETKDIDKSIQGADKEVSNAAGTYAKTSVAALPKIRNLQKNIQQVGAEIESPIDYNKSELKTLPLAADSITLDSQYFHFEQEDQSSESVEASLSAYVYHAQQTLGAKSAQEGTTAVTTAVHQQRENHDIVGTLVITANCTHKNALVWAPFIIDVDKGIRAWNEMFPNDQINPSSPASAFLTWAEQDTKLANYYNILSGATFGSSFVGMVHILRSSHTQSRQAMFSMAESFQANFETGCWMEKETGGFGESSTFAASARSLLSQAQIRAHFTLVCMGAIPTLKSNAVGMAIEKFSDFNGKNIMSQLDAFHNATASEQSSLQQGATAGRTGGEMMALKAQQIKATMLGAEQVDTKANQTLDIDSMMTAFTDYANLAKEGKAGVPIEYYLKPITKSQLAQMWVSKYMPGQFVTSAGDDSKPNEPGQGTT